MEGRLRDRAGQQANHAIIGFLPLTLGALLPTLSTDIRLSIEYARKLAVIKRLAYRELLVIDRLLKDSFCFREKASHLTFMWYDPVSEKPYTLVLKSARSGTETWLVTFHRTDEQQLRSKIRRSESAGTLFRRPVIYDLDE